MDCDRLLFSKSILSPANFKHSFNNICVSHDVIYVEQLNRKLFPTDNFKRLSLNNSYGL